MTAGLINAIKVLQYITILANSDPKKAQVPIPEPYPLPDTVTRTATKSGNMRPGSFAHMATSLLAGEKKRKEGGG